MSNFSLLGIPFLNKHRRVRVFKNKRQRRISESKQEVIAECRHFHNEELHHFYLLSDITVMIKLGRM